MFSKSMQFCGMLLLLPLLLPLHEAATPGAGLNRRTRITAKNNNNNNSYSLQQNLTQTEAKSLPATSSGINAVVDSTSKATKLKTSAANVASKYEIRGVSGEPNYKSVNLTWEVEFVPAPMPVPVTAEREREREQGNGNGNGTNVSANGGSNETATGSGSGNGTGSGSGSGNDGDGVTNMSVDVEPPKAFQIFYCEMQNYGPQRCCVKLVNGTAVQSNEVTSEQTGPLRVQHFAALVENLRMATKYSFHIRPAAQRRASMRTSSARAELFNENEIESELSRGHLAGQSIVIPTKGFSAHATQCLPHASEIEVETGPYFGGRIVVDGGNCGVKGDASDAADKYTMRIDHKQCGSMVKPETNTVETFITVQENLGIFTHSTRRFVVVCSYQSGMQTVRASFTVPGKQGVAAAIEPNDPFEPDELRLGREMRHMRYVNKSELVLKDSSLNLEEIAPSSSSEEQPAMVVETQAPEQQQSSLNASRQQGRALSLASLSEVNNMAQQLAELEVVEGEEAPAQKQRLEHLNTKYAKLVVDQPAHGYKTWTTAQAVKLKQPHMMAASAADDANDEVYAATLHYISANLGSVLVTVSISVIIISICIIVVHRLASQRERLRLKSNMALHKTSSSSSASTSAPSSHLPHKTLPRALQQQYQCTL